MLALRTVAVFVRDFQFLEQRVQLDVMLAEIVIAENPEPRLSAQHLRPAAQQRRDAVPLEVCLRAEDFPMPYFVGPSIVNGASQPTARPNISGCRSNSENAPQPDLLKPSSNRPRGSANVW